MHALLGCRGMHEVWHRPPALGVIKVNIDSAFPPKSQYGNFFHVSMVARNSEGRCIWLSTKTKVGRPLEADR